MTVNLFLFDSACCNDPILRGSDSDWQMLIFLIKLSLVIKPWFLACKRMFDTICDTKARGKQLSKNPVAAGNIVDNAHSHMSVALKCLDHIFMVAGDKIIYCADSSMTLQRP